jgi:HNH endonuclease
MADAIPKRTRFEVLRRDGYTCRYCGAKAPDVKLNVDAVLPVVLGGSHKDPANLVAACEACNNGKSSSHPDAPFVADVAEDALRFARVMKQAQAKMVADIESREYVYAQFSEWWGAWDHHVGQNHGTYYRPSGWKQEVDQLIDAGLPPRALKDCIAGAMENWQVGSSDKFSFMCGIAWKMAAEFQQGVRAAFEEGDEGYGPDLARIAARREMAEELLGLMGERMRGWYLDDARSVLGEDDPEAAECAAYRAFYEAVHLHAALKQLLESLEDGGDWIGEAHEKLFGKHGRDYSHAAVYSVAAQIGARASRNLPVGELIS